MPEMLEILKEKLEQNSGYYEYNWKEYIFAVSWKMKTDFVLLSSFKSLQRSTMGSQKGDTT